MRIEITDEVPPFIKPCCVGCLGYVVIAFLAVTVQAAGHRARAERIEQEKAFTEVRRRHAPKGGDDAHR